MQAQTRRRRDRFTAPATSTAFAAGFLLAAADAAGAAGAAGDFPSVCSAMGSWLVRTSLHENKSYKSSDQTHLLYAAARTAVKTLRQRFFNPPAETPPAQAAPTARRTRSASARMKSGESLRAGIMRNSVTPPA